MTELVPILSRQAEIDEARLRPSLRRFVDGRLRHTADSEDIVQEIYVRLYDYRRTRSIGDIGAFCFAAARPARTRNCPTRLHAPLRARTRS